jgi:hypothetical protein
MKRIMVLGALACVVSTGFAYKVRVDFDHGSHFSNYKTYRWVRSADAPSPEALFPNELMQDRISGFIDEALGARGLKRVTTGGDLLISYRMKVAEQPHFTTFSSGAGPGWGWDWGWGTGFSTTTVQTIYEGTLIIDIVDSNQQHLVFEGTATQTISSRPEKNVKKLAKAIGEVFEKYPPRP